MNMGGGESQAVEEYLDGKGYIIKKLIGAPDLVDI